MFIRFQKKERIIYLKILSLQTGNNLNRICSSFKIVLEKMVGSSCV